VKTLVRERFAGSVDQPLDRVRAGSPATGAA
jgi:hypothetical protein